MTETWSVILEEWQCLRSDQVVYAVAYRGGGGGGFGGSKSSPPPKFRRPSKIKPNSTPLWKLLKIAEFRTPKPQDVRKKGSKILKLPPVRNRFTLAMTNKLIVIINSLKVPKIKKILPYEINFLYKLQLAPEPQTRGLPPPDPRFLFPLSSTEFVEPHPPLPRTKFLGTPLRVWGHLLNELHS